jgi:hypothetical protein
VPADHLLRSIDGFVQLSDYAANSRLSTVRWVAHRMLIIGYCFGIRSKGRLWRLTETVRVS